LNFLASKRCFSIDSFSGYSKQFVRSRWILLFRIAY